MRPVLFLFLLLGTLRTLGAETLRVPADFESLHAAIRAANDGDRVLVSSGRYEIREPISFLGKGIHLLSEEGPERTFLIMGQAINQERASVFVFENAEPQTAIVEGFTVGVGRGVKAQSAHQNVGFFGTIGGAVFVGSHAEPRFIGNVFSHNEADHGGAVFVDVDAAPEFEDNHFDSNSNGGFVLLSDARVTITGGSFTNHTVVTSIRTIPGSVLVLKGVTFEGNSGDNPAALWHLGDFLLVSECTFIDNSSNERWAGAIEVRTANAGQIANIEKSTFHSNRGFRGGAIFASANNDGFRPIRISQCRFVDNRALGDGGAIWIDEDSSLVEIDSCEFIANRAGRAGGAVFGDYDSVLRVSNSSFIGNRALFGGGVSSDECELDLDHCVVVGNAAFGGGGIHSTRATTVLRNSIFWGNSSTDLQGFFSLMNSCMGTAQGHLIGRPFLFGDPLFAGWEKEEYVIDATVIETGDGSPDSPMRHLSDVFTAYSFDLAADSPCLTPGLVRPGLKQSQVVPAVRQSSTRAFLRAGHYKTCALPLIGLRGEDRDTVFVEGTAMGLRTGRSIESITIHRGLLGGIRLEPDEDTEVFDCRIDQNMETAVLATAKCRGRFVNVDISRNANGVPINADASNLSFESCRIVSNRSVAAGIGDFKNSDVVFTNCTIAANTSSNNSSPLIQSTGGLTRFTHTSFVENTPSALTRCANPGDLIFENSLFWRSGTRGVCEDLRASVDLETPDFVRPMVIDLRRGEAVEIGDKRIVRFPDFVVDPGDLRPIAASPAVDAASADFGVPTDIGGAPRPCGAGFDAGSYEGLCDAAMFLRGDGDTNGMLTIVDPILTLRYLFLGDAEVSCLDALDSNDDGSLALDDAILTLQYLFLGGEAPAAPVAECGPDPSADELSCEAFLACS